jgi:hypothetical protein
MKEITITMDTETGNFVTLDKSFNVLGTVTTKRASHVEPARFWLRMAFTVIRALAYEHGKIAAWTRRWPCLWRVNTSPVGGPILQLKHIWPDVAWPVEDNIAEYANRQDAIAAEIQFLNEFFLEAK